MKSVKLYTLPYAGASANFYLKWKKPLSPEVEVIPLELPGRGTRIKERPHTRLEDAVDDVLEKIQPDCGTVQYALFGHSMGNLLVFELIQRIRRDKLPLPVCAFLSGRLPPHIIDERKRYLMSDDDLARELVKMGGTPQEVLENSELLQLFLPVLRADFQLIETYTMPDGREPLDVPFVILSGTQDTVASAQGMFEWECHTTSSCEIVYFDGGHFFINELADDIIRLLRNKLAFFTQTQS